MAEHTQGPWRITGPNIRSDNHTDGTGALLFVQHRPFHSSDLEYSWLDPDEQAANLKLVAAAPDMLEALELAIGLGFGGEHPRECYTTFYPDVGTLDCQCGLAIVQAAIDKATWGESDGN